MVRMIRELMTRLIKILVTPKKEELETQYAEVWFPATRNKNNFD